VNIYKSSNLFTCLEPHLLVNNETFPKELTSSAKQSVYKILYDEWHGRFGTKANIIFWHPVPKVLVEHS